MDTPTPTPTATPTPTPNPYGFQYDTLIDVTTGLPLATVTPYPTRVWPTPIPTTAATLIVIGPSLPVPTSTLPVSGPGGAAATGLATPMPDGSLDMTWMASRVLLSFIKPVRKHQYTLFCGGDPISQFLGARGLSCFRMTLWAVSFGNIEVVGLRFHVLTLLTGYFAIWFRETIQRAMQA